MNELLIRGGVPLHGSVKVKGSKNASLPVIAASLLTDGPVVIEEVPDLLDVRTMIEVVKSLHADVNYDSSREKLEINAGSIKNQEPSCELVQNMRASFLVLGPLLARFGKARITLPGGCAIGSRPIDLHLKGLAGMGVEFSVSGGMIEARTDRLRGERIYLDYPSVGATENIMMAAAMAEGTTYIENAASEPEIVDLANFLNSAGARISGAGMKSIRIKGTGGLNGTSHSVIPDRIEAGTLILSAAVTGGDVVVNNVLTDHISPLVAKLKETGVYIEEVDISAVRIKKGGRTRGVDLKTLPYPGFPTDLQPQFMTLLALSEGTSLVTETVFENRFMHVDGLLRMDADVIVEGNRAVVQGRNALQGATVQASDLRASAALLLAGLAAEGTTIVSNIDYLWRGHSGLEERLSGLGAQIEWRTSSDQEQLEISGE